MTISKRDWDNYVNKLAAIDQKAAAAMQRYIELNGYSNLEGVVRYAYIVSTKYGEAAAELACEMYDATALASGMTLPPAIPANTATISETNAAIRGAILTSAKLISPTVARLVKQAAADTALKNAARDGAEWAWVPHGSETCAFCITLASRGWQEASKSLLYSHAEHIHANCRCQFAIRHNGKGGVEGYDPQVYKDMYYGRDKYGKNGPIDDDIIEAVEDEWGGAPESKQNMIALRRQLARNRKRLN